MNQIIEKELDFSIDPNLEPKGNKSKLKKKNLFIIFVFLFISFVLMFSYVSGYIYSYSFNTFSIEVRYSTGKVKELKIPFLFEKSQYSELRGNNNLILDLSQTKEMINIEKISVDLSEYNFTHQYVDIYKETEGELEYYELASLSTNKILTFSPNENTKYIIVYVPIEEILVESQEIIINKNMNYVVTPSIIPMNSTNKDFIYQTEQISCFSVNSNGQIKTTSAGVSKLLISVENEKMAKEVTVIVRNIPEEITVDTQTITIQEDQQEQMKAFVLPEDCIDQTLKWFSSDENIASVDQNGLVTAKKTGNCEIIIQTNYQPAITKTIDVIITEKPKTPTNQIPKSNTNTNNTTQNNNSNTSQLKYINGILVVNKQYSLPSTYNPGVNQSALTAFLQMQQDALSDGISLKIISGFRSYQTQQTIFRRNSSLYGEVEANRFSAKEGQSEHQTGLAFDINSTKFAFANTAEAKWLKENCHKYGFIVRYPEGKEHITGYVYEPWHIRYIGSPISTDIYNSGLCLEEYLGI